MNPKTEGLCDVFGDFGFDFGGKSVFIGDVDMAVAVYEEASRACEGPR